MGDVNSCGLRQSSDEMPALPRRPVPHQKTTPPRTRAVAQDEGVSDDKSTESECSDESDDLGPFNHELPQNLIRKLAKLARLMANDPYIAREIAERASKCLRFQFLQQCTRGNEGQCKIIWGDLDERDRRDFYRACQYKPNASECFFLDIMEPDSHMWRDSSTDCGSSVSDAWSDLSGSRPGSESVVPSPLDYSSESVMPSVVGQAQSQWRRHLQTQSQWSDSLLPLPLDDAPYGLDSDVVVPSSTRCVASDMSFNSLASAPRRRIAV